MINIKFDTCNGHDVRGVRIVAKCADGAPIFDGVPSGFKAEGPVFTAQGHGLQLVRDEQDVKHFGFVLVN